MSRRAQPAVPMLPSPPPASSPAARAVMQANRATDTRPEVALRSALHRRGLRFRKNARPAAAVRCRADVVFPTARVVVFVDGCFWHRCPQHGTSPSTNSAYWQAKLDRNVARDRRNEEGLAACGWTVIRVWEHEGPERAAARVEQVVRRAAS
ncbi:MAG TPA: very short patch repair endonuclease [Conexibacter sp.]|nr:very short patch repair endonuclease [Conexibacter sp.]